MSAYVAFLAIVVVMIFTANWGIIRQNFFNLEVAQRMFPDVVRAAGKTITYTAFSFGFGVVLAVVLALMKMSKGPFKWFAVVFIEFFRGIPALLTLMIIGFAVPMAFASLKKVPGVYMGLVGLVLVTGAYTAEIIRAGIVAVPKGQTEAARSLGMSHMRTMLTVVLPQAFRIVVPPLTNEIVMLLKDTSLLFVLGSTKLSRELTTFGRDGLTSHANASPLIVVAVFYLIITIPLTYVVGRMEKKMAVKQ
ncbi:MAG: amino acid ABC transporter permease [Propionibacteriaceae bacterium]|jgi:polar amino acid transport system permease protein|nr:amino acid ABC transporter permease [Propionibacteriaceae bacterium]